MAPELQRRAGRGSDIPAPPDPLQEPHLVIGVLTDLAGDAEADPSRPPAWVDVTHDGLDRFMASLAPRLVFRVADTVMGEGEVALDLRFRSMRDFSPDRARDGLPRLHGLQSLRDGMVALRSLLVRDPTAAVPADLAPFDPRTQWRAAAPAPAPPADAQRADTTAGRIRPRAGSFRTRVTSEGVWSSRAPKPVERVSAAAPGSSMAALVQAFVAETIAAAEPDLTGQDPVPLLDQRIDAIDRMIAEQLDAVGHAPAWRALQASWRGLDHLLQATQGCRRVRVRLMAVRRADLPRHLDRHDPAGAWQRFTPLARPPAGPAPVGLMLVAQALVDGVAEAPGIAVWGQAADLATTFERSGRLDDLGERAGAMVVDPSAAALNDGH
jgi:hypothetical protein